VPIVVMYFVLSNCGYVIHFQSFSLMVKSFFSKVELGVNSKCLDILNSKW